MEESKERMAAFYGQALERVQEGWKKLTQDDPRFSAAAKARTLMALLALFSILLPWVRLDGYTQTMAGSELLAFAFTSPERAAMFRSAPLGAIALLLIPFVLALSSIYAFFKSLEGQHTLGASIMGAALPLIMLFLAQTLTATGSTRIIGVSIPNPGIITMVLCNVGLIIHSLYEGPRGGQQ